MLNSTIGYNFFGGLYTRPSGLTCSEYVYAQERAKPLVALRLPFTECVMANWRTVGLCRTAETLTISLEKELRVPEAPVVRDR
jgi:hypothetical protein